MGVFPGREMPVEARRPRARNRRAAAGSRLQGRVHPFGDWTREKGRRT
jgi:hypothetical protein